MEKLVTATHGLLKSKPKKEELDILYNKERLSLQQIADKCGLTQKIVARFFRIYNIPRRSKSSALQAYHRSASAIPSPILSELYLVQKLSIRDIAKKCNVGFYWVRKCLLDSNIPIRPDNKSRVVVKHEKLVGVSSGHHPNSLANLKLSKYRTWKHHLVRLCVVCGRGTNRKTFCSRFCSNSPTGKQYRSTKIRNFLNALPKEEFNEWITRASRKPNQYETFLDGLLQNNFPGEWKFVGDGSLIIARKNPDFVNVNGKKLIIELWGNYWHKGEDPQKRIDIFRQYGYHTLILWASELRKPQNIVDKVISLEKEALQV